MARTQSHDFGDGTYAVTSGSNIGVIAPGDRALMVDAGLDRDAARKALRELEPLGAALAGVLITHGHADHFGGAAWTARRQGVPVMAPPLAGAYAHLPLLEPIFLHGGAAPISELRSKFTLARDALATMPATMAPGVLAVAGIEVQVEALPGHAPAQVGIGYPAASAPAPKGRTLFCGDAVFPQETMARHPILFCYDVDAWLATLVRLPKLAYDRVVPGHGAPVEDVRPLVSATAARLREIVSVVREAIVDPRTPGEVLRAVAEHFEVTFTAPQFLLLSQTTVNAALTSLQTAGEAEAVVAENRLVWQGR